jgi:Aldo/keto reductase family
MVASAADQITQTQQAQRAWARHSEKTARLSLKLLDIHYYEMADGALRQAESAGGTSMMSSDSLHPLSGRRSLGWTDLKVSALALGTMQFGWSVTDVGAFDLLDRFAEAGGNFIDTADMYGPDQTRRSWQMARPPPGAVALSWILAQPTVTAPIVGANSIGQLESWLPAANLELEAGELLLLDERSRATSQIEFSSW